MREEEEGLETVTGVSAASRFVGKEGGNPDQQRWGSSMQWLNKRWHDCECWADPGPAEHEAVDMAIETWR